MKTLRVVIFSLLGLFAVAGNSFAVATLGPGTYGIANYTLAPASSFNDGYGFMVGVPSLFGSNVSASSTFVGSNLTSLGSELYSNWGTATQALLATGSSSSDGLGAWSTVLNFTTLTSLTDEYTLFISGQVAPNPLGGVGGYGGTMTVSTISPVPEPEIYAMMGAGLALMGWVGRRRKLQAV